MVEKESNGRNVVGPDQGAQQGVGGEGADGGFEAGEAVLETRMKLALVGGTYTASVSLRSTDGVTQLARVPRTLLFYVSSRVRVGGIADLAATFDVRPVGASTSAPASAGEQEPRRADPLGQWRTECGSDRSWAGRRRR